MRQTVLFCVVVLATLSLSGQVKQPGKNAQTEMPDVASGKQTYTEYCATCHGTDGKGMGPTASVLLIPPSDLTTLAKKHGDKFPEEYVTRIVRLGKPIPAHGSVEMPIWGPVFSARDKFSELAVQVRIKNLCAYLNTLQQKDS